ncbi:hypothetical protein HBA54_21870 [Pelagibius litoralis]|uniref:GIY-YIG domain-containing protein n=1 Tax=Pelagibius litoralis TaxID=374515 RepID=A0A967F1H4_9PROT|nr:hypothetical protein [Pelagibius litoralis]NIA71252.1 hypothetical protein [Pelagibius litoralis]
MILYCTTNRDLELWYLDLAGALARPPVAPTVYALASFESDFVRYYVGSSRRLTARLGAHLSFARSIKLRGHSAGGRLLAPVVAQRQRALVIVLETCPGATTSTLQRCEQPWMIAATRDNGAAALAYQMPITSAPERGPQAPATLAKRRHWPTAWVEALTDFFREPCSPSLLYSARRRRLNASGNTARDNTSGTKRSSRLTTDKSAGPAVQEKRR